MEFLSQQVLLDHGALKIRAMTLPDMFQDHDNPEKQYEEAGLQAQHITQLALRLIP